MNYLHHWLIVGIACTTMTPTSWAGTVIERRDTQGNTQKIFLDENKARIDSSDPNRYTLMNLQEKKAYMVDSKEKRMVALDFMGSPPPLPPNMPKPPAQPPVKAELVKKGEGPKIAGYPTVNYQVLANGKECSENYLSPEATKIAYVQDFITAIYKMSDSRKPKGMPEHPCQQAKDDLEAKSMELGVPMKSMVKGGQQGEKDGPQKKEEKVRHEILSIKTDVKIPEDTFTLPKDYKVISEQELIKMMQADMKRRREEERQRGDRGSPSNRPDMQEDMRQRGEDGRQGGRDRRDDREPAEGTR
jgi:hypothetical protein